jgi:hypothetical protein
VPLASENCDNQNLQGRQESAQKLLAEWKQGAIPRWF